MISFRRKGPPMHRSLKRMADRISARRGPVERGLYAGTYKIRDRVKHMVSRQSTIGKKLWRASEAGSKRSNLGTYIRPSRVQHRGQTMEGGLELYGLPAMIEAGGETKSHPIFPKGAKRGRGRGRSRVKLDGKRLPGGYGKGVLRLANGAFVRGVFRHSATIRPHHFAERALRQHERLITLYIERALQRDSEQAMRVS